MAEPVPTSRACFATPATAVSCERAHPIMKPTFTACSRNSASSEQASSAIGMWIGVSLRSGICGQIAWVLEVDARRQGIGFVRAGEWERKHDDEELIPSHIG